MKNVENEPYIKQLKKTTELFASLKIEPSFIEWKQNVIDSRKDDLINGALACDLSTDEGQLSALTLLIAAKEMIRMETVFEEMEHYGEVTTKILDEPSVEN